MALALPARFSVNRFFPQQAGKQTLPITLDGRPFTIDFHLADAEPVVWCDFGYMRHEGDPESQGPGAGKLR
jgi:hypothetical protein